MYKSHIILLFHQYLTLYPNYVHAIQVLDFLDKYDNFWQRENEYGHITASAWVINKNRTKALLTHHKKLGIWVQLGGHIEAEDDTIYKACERELNEESGLKEFKLLSQDIFDIDVHSIPKSSSGFPEHFHFDIRLLFEANDRESIHFDRAESLEVQWIELSQIRNFTTEESVLRMVNKSIS